MTKFPDFTMRESLPPELQEGLLKIRDNLLICCVKRAGGKLTFPVEEVDNATSLLTMGIIQDPETGKSVFQLETKERN